MLSVILTVLAFLLVLGIGVGLAYLPMRLLMSQIAKNVRQFIQRQRERRRLARDTPDRRANS